MARGKAQAARRAYRSVTTKAVRRATRARMGKGRYSRLAIGTGRALRQRRLAEGTNPNTGTNKPRRKGTVSRSRTRTTTARRRKAGR